MSSLERRLLQISIAGAALTGIVLFWMKYMLSSDDPFSVVNHPWQPAMLQLHVLIVPLLVFALGLIAREHVIGRYLDRRPHPSRASGVAAMLLTIPMIVSGYLLEVLTGAGARRAMALAHVAAGGLFVLSYAIHLFRAGPAARSDEGRGRARRMRAPRARLDRSVRSE